MKFATSVFKLLLACWIIAYALIILLLTWMSWGATDFNGEPNTTKDHIVNVADIALSLLQLGLIPLLVIRPRLLVVGVLALSSVIMPVVYVISGGSIDSLIMPAMYSAGLVILYASAWGVERWGKRITPPTTG
jgi:hypothetical protein